MQEGGPRNPRSGTRGALVRALVPTALRTVALQPQPLAAPLRPTLIFLHVEFFLQERHTAHRSLAMS